MEIVTSTFIVLAALLATLWFGPLRGLFMLGVIAPFGMMAAFNLPAVGGMSIIGTDLTLLVLVCMLALQPSGTRLMASALLTNRIGLRLFAFYLCAIIITLFAPRLFAGETEVFSIARTANSLGIVSRPLLPSNGNLSQLLRMSLSILAFALAFGVLYLRPDARLVLRTIVAATVVHVGLGVIDILTQATGLSYLLDPIRTANYALTLGQQMAGLNRVIGGFPEASSYGYFTMGLFGFWLRFWYADKSGAPWVSFFLGAVVLIWLRGTSSSAYVAGGLLLVVFAVTVSSLSRVGETRRRTASILFLGLAALPVGAAIIVLLYQIAPSFTDFIDRSLLNKIGSDSGQERMSWNIQALRNLVDTWGLGAGLGSVRASNWFIASLATTGLIGTGLYVWFLVGVFSLKVPSTKSDSTSHIISALKWGCFGFLCRGLVVQASPNLQIIFFLFAGMAVGLAVAERSRLLKQGRHTFVSTRDGQLGQAKT